jgi:ArsR family transcriptional regulator
MDAPRQTARFEARAAIMKALAHASRLMIVDALATGEKCVCELTDLVRADISTVSKHLSVLKNAGLVDVRKQGQQVFYSLKCPCTLDFFRCIEKILQTRAREHVAMTDDRA